jgi:hypothetical protein
MSFRTNTDNSFKEGAFVVAKANPAIKLVVNKYYQRIYYCSAVETPAEKQLAYFERELTGV